MPDAVIDIIGVFPVQMLFAYALTKLLVIRNLFAYWALEILFVMVLVLFRHSMDVLFRLVASIPLVLVPLCMSEGRLPRRILAVALAHLVLFFAELPGGALWVAMTGSNVADYDAVRTHFGAFAAVHTVHFVLLVLLFVVLYLIFDRFANKNQGRGMWLPALFTSIQVVLVNVMILLPLGFVDEPMSYYAISVMLALLGLEADYLLFVAMGRYVQKQRDDLRASLLEKQLGAYLERCRQFSGGVEQVARLRHDMGNHLQVVMDLSERGRFREARDHLSLIRRELGAFDENEEAAPCS